MLIRFSIIFFLALFSIPSFAQEEQSLDLLKQKVESYVLNSIPQSEDSKIRVRAESIDNRLHLNQCAEEQLEVFNPYPNSSQTNTTMGIRCLESDNHWTLYVPVRVFISKQVLVAAHPLNKNDILHAEDLVLQERDIRLLRQGYLSDINHVGGLTCKKDIREGEAINLSMFQKPFLIHKGEQITIQLINQNIKVSMEAIALADGALNDTIKVRNLTSKRIIEAQVIDVKKVTVII